MNFTIREFKALFPDDKTCLNWLYKTRYPRGADCSKCGHKACFYPIETRKAYVCSWCGNQLSPTAGTIFHKSPTPLTLWFHAIFLMSQAKNGVAAKELQRHLGVTYKCAWRIAKQIRLLMTQDKEQIKSGRADDVCHEFTRKSKLRCNRSMADSVVHSSISRRF